MVWNKINIEDITQLHTITIIIGLVNDKSEILGENETFCSSPRLSQVWKRVLDSKITLQTTKLKTMTFDWNSDALRYVWYKRPPWEMRGRLLVQDLPSIWLQYFLLSLIEVVMQIKLPKWYTVNRHWKQWFTFMTFWRWHQFQAIVTNLMFLRIIMLILWYWDSTSCSNWDSFVNSFTHLDPTKHKINN